MQIIGMLNVNKFRLSEDTMQVRVLDCGQRMAIVYILWSKNI